MNRLTGHNFHLEITLLGGQSFSWSRRDDTYWGVTGRHVIKIVRDGDAILWQTFPENDNFELIRKYFRLDTDLNLVLTSIAKDEHIRSAIEKYNGLRLLHQDFVDTVLSFIVSQNSNIPKIKKSLAYLRKNYGNKVMVEGIEFDLYPSVETLADLSIDDLRRSGIGYRAPYVKRSFEQVRTLDLNKTIHSMEFSKARDALLSLYGVGEKVADCIMVFALRADHLTPLDVWAKRVITDLYNIDPAMNYREMHQWMNDYFGEYTSWAGQYLFEYLRTLKSTDPLE